MTTAAAETGKEEERKGNGTCVCVFAHVYVYIYALKCMYRYTICLYKEIHYVSIQADREHYRHNSVLLREKKNYRNVAWMLLSHQVFSIFY